MTLRAAWLALAACAHPGAACPDRVELALPGDVTAAGACTQARDVVVKTGAPLVLASLHRLERITGDLVVGPTVGVDAVDLDGLREVGGAIRIASNGSLRGVYLAKLERAGRIEIDHDLALSTIALPGLVEVAGDLVIADDHDLETLELPALARAGRVRIEGVPLIPRDVADAVRAKATTP